MCHSVTVLFLISAPLAQAADEHESNAPREQYEALLKEHDAPRDSYLNGPLRPRAGAVTERFLNLAREHPDDPVAIDALQWITSHFLYKPESGPAMDLLARDHLDSDRLGPIIQEIDKLYGGPFEPAADLCRAAMKGSPHREVRGRACLALAHQLQYIPEKARRDAYRHALFLQGVEHVPYAEKPKFTEADLARVTDESAALFEQVMRDYGDIKTKNGTLGQAAKAGLFELLDLAIGEPAPEIEGKDADGKPFRLSDYRGRVVVLSFSANWCAPCRALYPEERERVERLKDAPFTFLGVNADEDRKTLRESIAKGEITWRCWWDGDMGRGPICSQWNNHSFPGLYVIDAKGLIRYKEVYHQALDSAVDTLLKEMKKP